MKGLAVSAYAWMQKNRWMVVYMLLAALLVVTTGTSSAAGLVSGPTLDIDFSTALQTIFDYASLMFAALLPIAAVGIGLKFDSRLLEWVGDIVGKAF